MWDPLRDRMLIFGGETFPGVYLNAMWTLSLADPSAWVPLPTAGTPPEPRSGHAAIYDPARDRLVVFGGETAPGVYRNDVWILSLVALPAWEHLAPQGLPPTPRRGSAAVYDPIRDRLILFGGFDGGVRNDTWTLSLAGIPTWNPVATESPPPPRERHTAIYDPLRDRVLVFGGRDVAPRNDTWALSLAGAPSWSMLDAGAPPPPRCSHAAAYDAPGDRMLVFGGDRDLLPALDDTWSLSLADVPAWSPLGTMSSPPPRYGAASILDATRDRVIVCGGFNGMAPLADTWALYWGERTSIDPAAAPAVTTGHRLLQCAPNPFNPVTTLRFELSEARTPVTLEVYDPLGRLVRRLISGVLGPGVHSVVWDGRDDRGRPVASGIYVGHLLTDQWSDDQKLVLSK